MENNKEKKIEDYSELYGHTAARPVRYLRDEDGCGWLCDQTVNPHGDLRTQGCWRCDEMAFPDGGR